VSLIYGSALPDVPMVSIMIPPTVGDMTLPSPSKESKTPRVTPISSLATSLVNVLATQVL
jgi:hypothetical protein